MKRVWRFVIDGRSCRRWRADFPALETAAAQLLSRFHARFTQGLAPSFTLVQDCCKGAKSWTITPLNNDPTCLSQRLPLK